MSGRPTFCSRAVRTPVDAGEPLPPTRTLRFRSWAVFEPAASVALTTTAVEPAATGVRTTDEPETVAVTTCSFPEEAA